VSQTPKVFQNFIGGEYIEALADERMAIFDPATGAEYGTAAISNAADVDTAYQSADQAFQIWSQSTPAERQLALIRMADAMDARAEEIGAVESRDTGKPLRFAIGEVHGSARQVRFFAGAARNLEGRATAEYARDHTSSIRREPIGVIGQITPWNYPLVMATWKFAPAIAAGNTIVLKPSDTTPAVTLLLAEIASEFLPAGVFNVVTGDRNTGASLVTHKTPQMVAITGSVRAGMEVAKSAAVDVKRVHLELGGKAPVIIFADADLPRAARVIAEAGFYNGGQDCTAATRLLVHESVHDEFVALLRAEVLANAKTGAPDRDDVLFGPINNIAQFERVQGFVHRLPDHADIAVGGQTLGNSGYFHEATVLTGLKQTDEHVQDEIFGPILTVQKFSTDEEALRNANDVEYGLASSVWTSNHTRAMRFSKHLDFGIVWINDHGTMAAEMPHGGFRHSGYGKDLSMYGFEDYTRIKHVMSYIGD
jgi:betaine-aldehyde dehydrogenase